MNPRAARQMELAARIRGEIRRAAESASEAFEALQQLSVLGLESTDELFPGATSAELRAFACQLRALAGQSAQACAEIARVAGRVDALAALRDVTKE